MAVGNTNYSKVITTTLQNHGKTIFDGVSTNNALFFILKKAGNIKVVGGGRSFTHPIQYNVNSSYGAYSKMGAISTPLTDNITRAEYAQKVIAGSVVLSTLEVAQNSGSREKALDLVNATIEEAQISMSEVMGDQVWKDGSVAVDFDGLTNLIHIAPDEQTDVGGINPSTTGNEYWRNKTETTGTSGFNTTSAGLTIMNTLLNDCITGRQGPRAIFTTKAVYGLYEIGLTANIRYSKTDLADAGFRHLQYTTMPVLFDDNATTANMYMVDTDSLKLQVLARGNFEMTDFEYSHNQLAKISLLHMFGNLTCGSRRTQGVATKITG